MKRRDAAGAIAAILSLASVANGQSGRAPRDSVAARSPRIVASAPLTGREDIAVRSHVVPETVYVGQQATYEVGVFLSDDARERMRRNPEFVPPEMRSMLSYDLASPAQIPARIVDGRRYEVHVFRRALFPLAGGRLEIPPARLNYALPLSTSFFSREELHTERTTPTSLEVLEPPASGRPRDYAGAVGRLSIDATVDNRRGRVGDPLLLTVTVSGTGNLALVPRPRVVLPWGDAVSGAERIRIDTASNLVGGRKEFDFLLTPRRPGALTVPPVEYAFFDPYDAAYRQVASRPIDVVIADGNAVASERYDADSAALLPIRRAFRGDLPLPIPSSRWYWVAVAITPLPAILLAFARRPRRRQPETPLVRIRKLASQGVVDASALRRDFTRAISDRVPGASGTMSNHARLTRTLRRAGVSDDVAVDAGRLLAELDGAVFGNDPLLAPDVAQRAVRVLQLIDLEAIPRDEGGRIAHSTGAVLLLCAALGAGAAIARAAATEPFAEGVAAYDGRDLPRARAVFESIARERPRAADAWANAGSVAWQMGDTAAAAVGWHHALRLEPLAEDVREYLEFMPGFRGDLIGDVPPVPLTALGIVGGLLWAAGWYLAGLAPAVRVRRRLGGAMLMSALVIGLLGLTLNDVAHGRRAAVVAVSGRLRASPALNAEAGADVLPGELARTIGEQTAWTRVRFRDGRSGWLQSRDLTSLESR